MKQKGRYPRRLDHVVWKVVEERGILLNLEDGAYFEVNPVGLAVWQRCDGKTLLEEIVQAIAKEFRTSPDRARRDARPFIAELKRRRLLEFSSAPVRR